MKFYVSLRSGLFGGATRGGVYRMWKSATGATYRNDAGAAIPWAIQWPVIPTPRAGTKAFTIEVISKVASPQQGWRLVTLHRDGENGQWFGHYTAPAAEVSTAFPIPAHVLGGISVETGFAARSAELYLRRLTQDLNRDEGGGKT